MKPKCLKTLPLTIFVTVLAACSGNNREAAVTDTLTRDEAEKHTHPADITRTEEGKPEFTVDEVFQQQLSEVFDQYIELKDALVESDPEKVQREAAEAGQSLEKVNGQLVEGAANTDWTVYRDELSRELNNIRQSDEIGRQREHFSKLSYSLYKSIKAFGLGGSTAYYDFCPMAFNDKGAYWLSDEEAIRNPYFGDEMLSCGSIEETLR